MKTIVVLFAFARFASSQQDLGKKTTAELIEAVREDPTNEAAIGSLFARSDSDQVVPALRDAFEANRISGSKMESDTYSMRLSQLVASYLFEKGVRDQVYFDEIAKYAREAILADPPEMVISGGSAAGDPRNKVSPTFDRWCGSRGLEFAGCFRLAGTYRTSLNLLAAIKDPRAVPILRDVLKMSDPGMISWGVAGLAALNDSDSIPMIIQAGGRFAPDTAAAIAAFAMGYNDPKAEVIFDRLVSDPGKSAQFKAEWRARIAKQAIPGKN